MHEKHTGNLCVDKGAGGQEARLAQSVEHETLNLRVVGSSPTLGAYLLLFLQIEGSAQFRPRGVAAGAA